MTYEVVYKQAQQLSVQDRLRLADALLAEELGFGMWREQADFADVSAWLEKRRTEEIRQPNGRLKTPAEFLHELKAFDE